VLVAELGPMTCDPAFAQRYMIAEDVEPCLWFGNMILWLCYLTDANERGEFKVSLVFHPQNDLCESFERIVLRMMFVPPV
jgi:hypothetical protein